MKLIAAWVMLMHFLGRELENKMWCKTEMFGKGVDLGSGQVLRRTLERVQSFTIVFFFI